MPGVRMPLHDTGNLPQSRPGDWPCPRATSSAAIAAASLTGYPVQGVHDAWRNYSGAGNQIARQSDIQTPSIPTPYLEDSRRPARGQLGDGLNQQIEWQGLFITPVVKDFSFEHPDVAALTSYESDKIRMEQGIHIFEKGEDQEVPKPVTKMEEVPFPEWMFEWLRHRKYQKPTAIQVQAWPAALQGRDIIGVAETGSGKTLAYVLPMLVHILAQPELAPLEGPVGLVLVPTRELCKQVADEINDVAEGQLKCGALYGGAGQQGHAEQDATVAERCDVIVATPNSLIALLERKATNLRRATYVVLDEADELLSQGFERSVRLIISQIRPDRQVLFFSATWDDGQLKRFAQDICKCKPLHVSCCNESGKLRACSTITQNFWRVGILEGAKIPGADKLEVLLRAVSDMQATTKPGESGKSLIFCNKKDTVDPVKSCLVNAGFNCAGFSGNITQQQRMELLQRFADDNDELQILVCTNLLGRGHDFKNVKFVINYDMPNTLPEYVHRIGRTGRAGQQGFSLTLLEDVDLVHAKDICDMLDESKGKPESWLSKASTKKNLKLWRQLKWNGPTVQTRTALPPPETQRALPPVPAEMSRSSPGGHSTTKSSQAVGWNIVRASNVARPPALGNSGVLEAEEDRTLPPDWRSTWNAQHRAFYYFQCDPATKQALPGCEATWTKPESR